MKVDYIIVGQGLAGTLVAHFLKKAGKTIHIIDDENPNASSKIAAGIVNPITGRHYIKTWFFEELMPKAIQTYAELSQHFGYTFYEEKTLIRSIFKQADVNVWLEKTDIPSYAKYVEESQGLGSYDAKVEAPFYAGRLKGTAKVNIPLLVKLYKEELLANKELRLEPFDFDAIQHKEEEVIYKDITASKLLFCEGWRAIKNPLFQFVDFYGAKGEVLFVEFPDDKFDEILKHKTFVVPLSNQQYWIGATNLRHAQDETPTPEIRAELLSKLDSFIKVPYKEVAHKAAIRPTMKDRKPVIGYHPILKNIALFNGLGGKGATLGPYFADKFVNYMLYDEPLEKVVRIERFFKNLKRK